MWGIILVMQGFLQLEYVVNWKFADWTSTIVTLYPCLKSGRIQISDTLSVLWSKLYNLRVRRCTVPQHTSRNCTNFPSFSSPVCVCSRVWKINSIRYAQDRIKLSPNKIVDKESCSVPGITMQYHHAVRTAAELCSLGIRMLKMLQFINSLQIGPQDIEIHPNASLFLFPSLPFAVKLSLSVSAQLTPVSQPYKLLHEYYLNNLWPFYSQNILKKVKSVFSGKHVYWIYSSPGVLLFCLLLWSTLTFGWDVVDSFQWLVVSCCLCWWFSTVFCF